MSNNKEGNEITISTINGKTGNNHHSLSMFSATKASNVENIQELLEKFSYKSCCDIPKTTKKLRPRNTSIGAGSVL